MIIIIWSDDDGQYIEKFGEGIDGTKKAEAKILELHNLENSADSNDTTIDMVIRGSEVQYEVQKVASKIKVNSAL